MDPRPFDSPDAEAILRTSDGTSLRVHSRILTESSPFFRDLLALPQPISDEPTSSAVVNVSENGEVIHTLLMLIYPIEDTPVQTLSLLGDVLGAALKYDIELAVQSLRRQLVSQRFIKDEPSRVYAIACRHGLEDEAKLASSYTLTTNILDGPPADELRFITAYDYHKLLELHRTRGTTAQKLLAWDHNIRCPQCSKYQEPSRWWIDWSSRAKKEVQQKPTTDVIFSLPFLAQSSQAGCPRCGSNILDSHQVLSDLKKSIDDLPSTI